MSGPRPVFTFVRAEEDKHTLSVYYRDEAGTLASTTFSDRGEPEGHTLRSYSRSGWRPDEPCVVELYFAIDGAEGVNLFSSHDVQGNVVEEGVFVTHSLRLALSVEDASRLEGRVLTFMQTAEAVVERLTNGKPHVDALVFDEDHIAVTSFYDTLTLSLTQGCYRFTFNNYGLRSAPVRGFIFLRFGFLDENGEEFHVQFAAENDDAARMDGELKAFFRAHPEFGKTVNLYGVTSEVSNVTA